MTGMGTEMGAGMGWWMIAFSIFWLVLFAIAVWAFVRWTTRAAQPTVAVSAPASSAMEILRQRFARGEIDGDTFERMRRQLEAASEQRTPATIS